MTAKRRRADWSRVKNPKVSEAAEPLRRINSIMTYDHAMLASLFSRRQAPKRDRQQSKCQYGQNSPKGLKAASQGCINATGILPPNVVSEINGVLDY